MEDIRAFNKGLNKDSNLLSQPAETYSHALNVVQLSESGDMYSLVNERGTDVIPIPFPTGFKLIGQRVLDRDVIVFLVDDSGNSQIGVVDAQFGYTRAVPDPADGVSGDTNTELGFSINNGISVEAKKLFNGDRAVYFTDGVNEMRFLSIDSPPKTGEIADNVKVIPNLIVPNIDYVETIETFGRIKPGAVQFLTVYNTAELTETVYSGATEIVPVVENVRSSGINKYDGEYQDFGYASKSIKLNITNIDTSFPYLSLIAVRYEGDTNTLVGEKLEIRNISGTTMEFIYTGSEDYTELTREELRALPISYSSAKSVVQKNNILFWSNLKDTSAEFDQELQLFFNDVTTSYTTETFEHNDTIDSTNITGYKDEAYTFSFKGYMRDEVYSLGAVVTFLDGSTSSNYHIPGNAKGALSSGNVIIANNGNELDTYVSIEEYPLNQNYPGILSGDDTTLGSVDRRVRHHKFPSIEDNPHFSEAAGVSTVSIMGVSMIFNKAMSPALLDKIQSITITRQRRDINQNKNIIAQGIGQPYIKINTEYAKSDGGGSNPVYKKLPFFHDTSILINDFRGNRSAAFDLLERTDRSFAFYSPESHFGLIEPSSVIGTTVKPVMNLLSPVITDKYQPSTNIVKQGVPVAEHSLRNYFLLWLFGSYDTIGALTNTNEAQVSESQYIDLGEDASPGTLDETLVNKDSSRHLFIETSATDPVPSLSTPSANGVVITLEGNFDITAPPGDTNTENNYDSYTAGPVNVNLLNLIGNNTSQYGQVGGATYIPISKVNGLPTAPGLSTGPMYGGDTFINKFAVRNSDIYFYKGLSANQDPIPTPDLWGDFKYENDDATSHVGATQEGMDLRSISYFFVESTVNCDYRHQFVDRSVPDAFVNGVEYYPNNTSLETNEIQVQEGDSHSYNRQYSFENNVKVYFNKSAQASLVGSFSTRTIYSRVKQEDELSDSFRVYPVNNFYDLPQDTGEIWSNFIEANVLYLHTPKALWRTFANDVSTQTTDLGDVIMGTGDMFSLPSKQMSTTDGGHGGTIAQWGAINTPYGRVFADVLQGKIFLLHDGQLAEISKQGLKKFFFTNLKTGLVDTEYIDKPFAGLGIHMGWDPDLEKVMITKVSPEGSFTYSYSFLSGVWISEHSYTPEVYYTLDEQMYSVINDGTAVSHSHNTGDYGSFYGEVKPMELDYIHNLHASEDKTFDNLTFKTKSFNGNTIKPLDTWDKVSVSTDLRATGDLVIRTKDTFPAPYTQGEVWASYVKNKYMLSIPGNAVVDEFLNITDPSNIDQSILYKSRIKGDAMKVSLRYLNSDNYKFMVNFMACTVRLNAR